MPRQPRWFRGTEVASASRVVGGGTKSFNLDASATRVVWDDFPHWERYLVPAVYPPLLIPWTHALAREALLRSNTTLHAAPFEGRSLEDIRSRPLLATASPRLSPSDAGSDVEAELLHAVRAFLARAGRRPLDITVGPSKRAVIQLCASCTAMLEIDRAQPFRLSGSPSFFFSPSPVACRRIQKVSTIGALRLGQSRAAPLRLLLSNRLLMLSRPAVCRWVGPLGATPRTPRLLPLTPARRSVPDALVRRTRRVLSRTRDGVTLLPPRRPLLSGGNGVVAWPPAAPTAGSCGS